MKNYKLFALSFILFGCVTVSIKNTKECTVAGVIQGGMDCATSNSGEVSQMDFPQTIDWLEPQPERPDLVNGKTLPARAGAVCRSDEDFTAQKVAIEQACELLKTRCTPELHSAIESMNRVSTMVQFNSTKKTRPE